MRILITGVGGFVGSHLVDLLLSEGFNEIYGILRRNKDEYSNIKATKDKIKLKECDLTNFNQVIQCIEEIKPNWIFHLAARSIIKESLENPAATLINNITSTMNILEAMRKLKEPNMRLLLVGSAHEYGMVYKDELPIKETNPLRPITPYGVSKLTESMLGYQYYMNYNLYIIRIRAFNHTGPRRSKEFAESNFAYQIAKIEKNKQEAKIYVGDLSVQRDFTDVRDIVRAYLLAIQFCSPQEVYNICSGVAFSIKEILDILLSYSNMKIEIKEEKNRMRPIDVPKLIGSYEKFHLRTGWKPTIPIKDTLKDLLDYWRQNIN